MKLRDRSKQRINKIIHDYDSGLYSDKEFAAHVAAWNGHAMHADSYRYRVKKLGDYCEILDFDKLLSEFERVAEDVRKITHYKGEPKIVLLVHEKPDNLCSERSWHWYLPQPFCFRCVRA